MSSNKIINFVEWVETESCVISKIFWLQKNGILLAKSVSIEFLC